MCCSWSGAAILWPLQWALTEKQMLHVVFTRWRWSVHFSSSIQSTLVCSLYVAFWICQLGKDKEGIGDEDTKLTPRKARSLTTHSHSISATSTHTRPFYQEHSLLTMNNRFLRRLFHNFAQDNCTEEGTGLAGLDMFIFISRRNRHFFCGLFFHPHAFTDTLSLLLTKNSKFSFFVCLLLWYPIVFLASCCQVLRIY